jgi:hypothetical protein
MHQRLRLADRGDYYAGLASACHIQGGIDAWKKPSEPA